MILPPRRTTLKGKPVGEASLSVKTVSVDVRKQRGVQRQKRQRVPVPTAAIVGYTNAGKSSLLNALTGASVLAEDKLFATLDPTTRQLLLRGNQKLLVTDTVGFIRRLPHGLVHIRRLRSKLGPEFEAIIGTVRNVGYRFTVDA